MKSPPTTPTMSSAPPAPPAPPRRREVVLVTALLLGLALAVYGATLGNGFVSDDHRLVEVNPLVRTLDPVAHLRLPFWLQGGRWSATSAPR